ncbi:hypothetical protein AWV79_02115 [Cupriavidus sp. UYMMa02A]|nr:hypothetical protein AWV79_02115 [Cupriavidus sp. UYMMa02A]
MRMKPSPAARTCVRGCDAPGCNAAGGVFAVQFDVLVCAAQTAHRLTGNYPRRIETAMQGIDQRTHSTYQAH